MARAYDNMTKRRRERIFAWRRESFPLIVTCAGCGKRAFTTRKDAKREAARWVGTGAWHSGGRPRVYEHDGYFHVTSVNAGRMAYYREAKENGNG